MLKNELEIGGKLYSSQRGYLEITDMFETYFVVSKGQYSWEQNYYDIGKVLFFDITDYSEFNTAKFNHSRYLAYRDAKCLTDLENEIGKQLARKYAGKTEGQIEEEYEIEHFEALEKDLKHDVDKAKENLEEIKLSSNGNSETFDSSYVGEKERAKTNFFEKLGLYNEPYFAEIMEYDDKRTYIGKKSIENNVVDWRDEHYGRLYRDSRFKNDTLIFVREFFISMAKYHGYKDTFNRKNTEDLSDIRDELLLRAIQENRQYQELVNLARTIASDQYDVIMKPLGEDFIVEGCAGSGKTIMLLHRLSTLLFNRNNLKPEDMIIVSPNDLLNRQSDNIAIDLELDGVQKKSLNDLYITWVNEYFRKFNIEKPKSLFDMKKLVSNDELPNEFVGTVYSQSNAIEFDNLLLSIISNYGKSEEFDFENRTWDLINLERRNVYGGIYDGKRDEYIISFYEQIANDYEKVCNSVSEQNARARLESLNVRIEAEKRKIENYNNEELNEVTEIYQLEIDELETELADKEKKLAGILYLQYIGGDVDVSDFASMTYVENKKFGREICTQLEREIAACQQKISETKKDYEKTRQEYIPDKEYAKLMSESEALELFIAAGDLKGEIVYTAKDTLSVSSTLFSNLVDFYSEYHNRIPEYLVEINGSEMEFFRNNYRLSEKLARFYEFKYDQAKYSVYLVEIIDTIINSWKLKYGVGVGIHFEFELMYLLRGFNLLFGHLTSKYKHISFDEYQEYSAQEISLVKKIHKNCNINLYGETRQCINPKGIKNDNVFGSYYKKYRFETNYRNGRQITEYINKNLGTDMKAIGINSTVDVSGIQSLNDISFIPERRIALLVRSKDEYDEMFYNKENDNVCMSDDFEIDKKKLNVIPIKYAKGLEFEEVYVYERNMSQNEKYVAYTRALEHLKVLE